jgi:kynurenine formamidase
MPRANEKARWVSFAIRLSFILFLLVSHNVFAQTRDKGPWWPNAQWGKDDQAGGSNWITPEKIIEALKLVKTGKVYELGQIYSASMPLFGARTFSLTIPGSPTAGPMGTNRLIYHDEYLATEIGQVGTQFDGPGHIGQIVKMADGTEKGVFYNGFTLDEIKNPYGLLQLGVEHVKPIFTRGILIDIAGYKGVDVLANSYEVTVADVQGALRKQGISEAGIRPGDALFFRYGWSKYWTDPTKYNTNPPGIGLAVARWVAEKKLSMIGSDQFGTEVMPNPDANLVFPVHQELLMKNGIWNLENMVFDELAGEGAYEFLFVFTPVRFKGATGSPGRPIAVR